MARSFFKGIFLFMLLKIFQKILQMFNGFINQIFIGLGLSFVCWLCSQVFNFYQKDKQKKIAFVYLKKRLIDEIDYNCLSGVGSSKSPFCVEVHEEFLYNPNSIDENLKDEVKKIINEAKLCNGDVIRKVKPGHVKSLEKSLREKIV
jgi:hypothetical protein